MIAGNRLRIARATLLLAAALLASSGIADTVADKVSVTDAYVRAVPPVVKTSAAFMQLRSVDVIERFLVNAESPAAGVVELHMHEHDDGVMRMRRIVHIHLPPQKDVSLEPGGLHVMLFDLKKALKPGDSVPITLIFDDDSRKTIDAPVRSVTDMMRH